MEQQILDGCNLLKTDSPEFTEIITTNSMLKTAREGAMQDVSHAIKMLVSSGIALESAQEICSVLAGEHSVSALHLAIQTPEKTARQESATVLSGQSSTWLMTDLDQGKISLKTIGKSALSGMLQRWANSAGAGLEIPAV